MAGALPSDLDDHNLPGRYEEGDSTPPSMPPEPKSSYAKLAVCAVLFIAVSVGFFAYYFANQAEIDSGILQNTYNLSPEEQMAIQYNVGKFGSAHEHAALVVIIDDEALNFALPQFQLASKYIHFENHNPYLIHRHATNVPLEMLFASFGMQITPECIILYDAVGEESFCQNEENPLLFYVNGAEHADISGYIISQGDRILISFGDRALIPMQLAYLDSLRIFDAPERTTPFSRGDISL